MCGSSTRCKEDEDDLRADIAQTLDSHSSRTIESYGIVNGDVLLVCGTRNARVFTNKEDGREEGAHSQAVLEQILDKVVARWHAGSCLLHDDTLRAAVHRDSQVE